MDNNHPSKVDDGNEKIIKLKTTEEQFEKIKPVEYFFSFINWARADSRLVSIKNFKFLHDLEVKFNTIGLLLNELIDHYPLFVEEQKFLNKQGYSSGLHSNLLRIKYENFLKEIYSLMQNISYIAKLIYNKHNLSENFYKQKKAIIQNDIDNEYRNILLRTDEWYPIIETIRDENAHYLNGMVVFFSEGSRNSWLYFETK